MHSRYISQILITTAVILSVNGCGGGGSDGGTTSSGSGTTLEVTEISHNSVGYNAITSSSTGRIWLDRNLGASQSCSSSDDYRMLW